MSEKAEKGEEGGDVEEKLSGETPMLNQGDSVEKEEKGRRENNRELKLRYLNSFSGLADSNSFTSKRQNVVERLVDDPHFDVFFLSSSQFCSLETNKNQCQKNERKI